MLVAIDTETYKFNKSKGYYEPILDAREFVIGCVITDKGFKKFFYNRDEMYRFLINLIEDCHKKGIRVYIYAHHTEYDWYAIARKELINDKIKYISFNPFLAIYDNKGYILDTMAFFRTSLDNIGRMLGYEKKEMPKKVYNLEELKEYVERDTEIVLKAIQFIKERLACLGFKPRKLLTAGQVAMTCFMTFCRRNYYLKYFCEFSQKNKRFEVVKCEEHDNVRLAYRGGDNQALKIGTFDNVSAIDVNGLYAHIMRELRFPDLRTQVFMRDVNIVMFKKYIKEEIGVAQVTINAPSTRHPVLPIRFSDYQVFPSYKSMKGTWTFDELDIAIKEGYEIVKIHWCSRWKELIVNKKPFNPFKEFINVLWKEERKCRTKMEKAPIKLIRNNLPAKFAQKRKNKDYKLVLRENSLEYMNIGYRTVGNFDDKYIMVKEDEDYIPSYINPLLSLLVTSRGRLFLHEEEKKIPVEKRLYKDTDSLIFIDDNPEILNKFKIGFGLGEWKIEDRLKRCKILGEKRYWLGDKVTVSGLMMKERSKKLLNEEENVKVKRMRGILNAMDDGNWDKVGSFEEREIDIKSHNKQMLILPDFIDETR